MAFYSFRVPFDTLGTLPLESLTDVEIYSTTANEIRAGLGGVTLVVLQGNFILDETDQVVGGQLTGWRTFVAPDGAAVESEASGLSIDLLAMVDWVLFGDEVALLNAFFGGNDVFTGSYGADVLAGYTGNDLLRGGDGNDTLLGDEGDDTLEGGAGADSMEGGNGWDRYEVREVGDQVVESTPGMFGGFDSVLTWLPNYTLPANVENVASLLATGVRLVGNELANQLLGGAGNDTLVGLGDFDRLNGSDGIDTADYGTAPSYVDIDLTRPEPQGSGGAGADTLVSIENLVGSRFADRLTGDAAANRIDGGGGADTLDGGAGIDTLAGGNGADVYTVQDVGDLVVEATAGSAGGVDTVRSWLASYTLPANVENGVVMSPDAAHLSGNGLANVLAAGPGDNRLAGGGGRDTVSYEDATAAVRVALSVTTAQATGGSGRDTLTSIESLKGSDFADRLSGSAGVNVLRGGLGDDTLTGGSGHDTLTGGGGHDTFRFLGSLTGNVDTLTDFVPGRDRLELENGVFWKLANAGPLAAVNFRATAAGTAQDANDFVVYETDTGKLFYDADGSGSEAAVLVAVLTGAPALAAADIFVT